MQPSPENYDLIYSEGDYDFEYKVVIDGKTYTQDLIWSLKTSRSCISSNSYLIGNAMVGEIDLTVTKPRKDFARMASIVPYIRLYSRSRHIYSGWAQKGEFIVDTRPSEESDRITLLTIEGYDAMRKACQPYPSSELEWTSTSPHAFYVVKEIADKHLGVEIDGWADDPSNYTGTCKKLYDDRNNLDHVVGFPAQFSDAEVLGSIAAMYGGNFIISNTGTLMLQSIFDIPDETFYLIDENFNAITFGGDRILVTSPEKETFYLINDNYDSITFGDGVRIVIGEEEGYFE